MGWDGGGVGWDGLGADIVQIFEFKRILSSFCVCGGRDEEGGKTFIPFVSKQFGRVEAVYMCVWFFFFFFGGETDSTP